MSFDLFFFSRSDARLDWTRLCQFLVKTPGFEIHTASQIWYQSPTTGVYFSIDRNEALSEPDDDPDPPPSGFYATRISFNLNFNRPCFFALEAMPWVERIAHEFNLWILNPQQKVEENESVMPGRFTAEELIESWDRSNSWAVRALHRKDDSGEETDYCYCSRANSLYWWNYTREQEGLQNRLGDSIYVPSMMFLRREKEPRALLSFLWSDALPQVFPQADCVIHHQMGRNWRGKLVSKKLQVLPAEHVVQALEGLLVPCASSIPSLRTLRPADSREIKAVFRELGGAPFDKYQRIASDGFVDVALAGSR